MRDLEISGLSVSHGQGHCDCCLEWKPLVVLDGSAELVGLCLDCLPSIIKAMQTKARQLAERIGGE